MAILPTSTSDYSDFDFDSLRARIFNLISAAFPDWTEQSVASFGNLLVELFAHVGDVLGFYIDARARESRLTTAVLRESVIALAKLLNYTPEGATAASTDLVLTFAPKPTAVLRIAAGSIVRTLSPTQPIEFQTLADVEVEAGVSSATVPAEHSATFAEIFVATGLSNQEVRLTHAPFLNVMAIAAANGLYTRVGNFLGSTSADRHYVLLVDQNDYATLRFGSGTNGTLPAGSIAVRYKTGGGPEGNIEANTLRRVLGTYVDELGAPIQVTCTNPSRATGGQPRRSRAQIQQEAPQQLTALTRTVGRADYEINARRVPGVARALMLTSNQVRAIRENSGLLYVVPAGGGRPSTAMLEAVYDKVTVEYPNTITFEVQVRAAEYLVVDIQATVFLVKGASKKQVDTLIRDRLTSFFSLTIDAGTEDERDNPNVNFGFYASQTSEGLFDGALALSDLQNVVRDTPGVRKLGDGINDFLVRGSHSDVKVQAQQFPVLGKVVLVNGETHGPLAGA